jgi:hypothetical protein
MNNFGKFIIIWCTMWICIIIVQNDMFANFTSALAVCAIIIHTSFINYVLIKEKKP